MSQKLPVLFALFIVLLALALPALAQEGPAPIASGLNYPRGMAYDSEGNLYIAEAGVGGELEIPAPPPAEPGTMATAGLTSQVSMVAPDGTVSVAVPLLMSANNAGEAVGAESVFVTDESLWLVLSATAPNMPFAGNVVELDRETNRVKNFIDLWAYEMENNPDATEEINSNANDVMVDDEGTVYIADAGANAVYTWTEADGLNIWMSWDTQVVPTSLAMDSNGDIYVSFLGEGIAPGAGHIHHYTADGELVEAFDGLTGVTDIAVDADDNLYAVQLFTAFGEEGPDPASGNVVQVTADGATPIMEGLGVPYGLAISPDGEMVVSVGTVFAPPGSGAVLPVAME
jgi:sugar lactone lactonase YvrE